MNAEVSISSELKEAHREAIADFNRWRGRCTDCFARIDDAARRSLLAFSQAGESKLASPIPHLFGARLEALRHAISPDGAFHNKLTWKALGELQRWLKLRNVVIHGFGGVWINGSKDWLWQYEFLPNGKAASLVVGTIDSELAAEMEAALSSGGRSLCDRLRNQTAKLV